MSHGQESIQPSLYTKPTGDDRETWKDYWAAQRQVWRTEPEIDEQRQAELARRRQIVPDVKLGIYPFSDCVLRRPDIEWLLASSSQEESFPATSESTAQKKRYQGLDVRGACLQHEDLRNLPLANILAEITREDWQAMHDLTEEQRALAAVNLTAADLRGAHLEGALLAWANLEKADLRYAHLEGADLVSACLDRANLGWTHLEGANLSGASLKGAYVWKTHLERSNLRGAYLDGAFLGEVVLSDSLFVGPRLVDVRWGNSHLSAVRWSQVQVLGDEYEARQKAHKKRKKKKSIILFEYEEAVRANRQLAIALAAHGLNEDSSRFAYRAQRIQRTVLKLRRKPGSYLFSWTLDLLAGYGYRPERSLIIYLLVISLFACMYMLLGHTLPGTISPISAVVMSLSSFHGRGFLPSGIPLDHPIPILAALEAMIGLMVEISFITTFTQRFLNK